MRAIHRRARLPVALGAALALTAALASGPTAGEATAAGRYSKRSRTVTGGLTFIRLHDSRGPNRIRILKIDPASPVTLDVALSNNSLPMRETTTSMVARHNAIAGINASVGNSWGRPIGLFAEDATLKASPYVQGGILGLSRRPEGAHIGHHVLRVSGRTLKTGKKWSIRAWNTSHENRERVAAFTPAARSSVEPEGNSCAMRIAAKGGFRWSPDGITVQRRYRVTKVQCADAPLARKRKVVLGARRGSRGARIISTHTVGQHVRLSWSVGWPGVVDALSGTPVLINDGVMIEECEGYVCQRHPRTGVGVLPNGKVLLVTVDGRQSDSVGMTVFQFARLFRHLGADEAINLDGGGSSTMVLKGNIVNDPSDPGGQRAVVSALIVHNGQDADEPIVREPQLAAPFPYETTAGADDLAMTDPASTGGVLDALARGGFGDPPVELPGALRDGLSRFRRSIR